MEAADAGGRQEHHAAHAGEPGRTLTLVNRGDELERTPRESNAGGGAVGFGAPFSYNRPMGRVCLALLACIALAGCAAAPTPGAPPAFHESTFNRVVERAERGDAESQNAAGFMLHRGEGVERDPARARAWFERAAAAGNERARRNLAYLQSGAAPLPATPAGPSRAEVLYQRYCGGCHGLEGVAAYENSPSFAFGERLHKAESDLLRSLLDGLQEMPGWEGKLPTEDLRAILAFVRALPARYDAGIGTAPSQAPAYMYLFGRMEERRSGQAP